MSRKLRPYLPGTAFHLTARIAFRRKLFMRDGVRDSVCNIIADSLEMTDARLLAFCIMSNHLHLIVAQGIAPLSRLMRPLMTRTALLVKRTHRIEGRVFGNVYHAFPTAHSHHLRRAIVYTHLNPFRTKAREDIQAYPWSSHSVYSGGSSPHNVRLLSSVSRDLRLFARNGEHGSFDDYLQHVDYWRHDFICRVTQDENKLAEPNASSGDCWYRESYVPAMQKLALKPKEDLRDIAQRIVDTREHPVSLQAIRTRGRHKHVASARKEVAVAAFSAGYSVGEIAAFLGVTSGRVSQMTNRLQSFSPPVVRRRVLVDAPLEPRRSLSY